MDNMAVRIQIAAHEEVEEGFSTRIRTWANEVLERAELLSPSHPPCITIWGTVEKLQAFYREE
jgi:hypothetical protein